MKTLILNGSPRPNGDTAALLKMLRPEGEVVQLNAFELQLRACVDCRWCRSHEGCTLKDEMQTVYPLIEQSDRIIIASPVWFGTLTPPLLAVASRVQRYFSARFFQGKPALKGKKGAVILTAGGSGGKDAAFQTASIILREMGADAIAPLAAALHTDRLPAAEDPEALNGLAAIEEFFK